MTIDVRAQAWQQWSATLANTGGGSPLVHCDLTSEDLLDLSSCHPGGLAQFVAAKPTRLLNLIRDDVARRKVIPRAKLIEQRAASLAEDRGIDAVALATGFAKWEHDGQTYCAPIFLQHVQMRAVSGDYELRLDKQVTVNRAFVEAMWQTLIVEVDTQYLLAKAWHDDVLSFEVASAYLKELTKRAGVEVLPMRVLSTFASVAGDLQAATSEPIAHPVLDAIADVPGAKQQLHGKFRQVTPVNPDLRSPESDTLILDAAAEQEQVVAQAAAGDSFVVRTVPGCAAVALAVNIAGELMRTGKRIAVVAASRATLRDFERVLDDAGLGENAIHPETLRRDVITAITARERARKPFDYEVNKALVESRSKLADYRESLHKIQEKYGVSVHQTLGELAALAMRPYQAGTTVRLHSDTVHALVASRPQIAKDLAQLAELGEFNYGPHNSAWYGAKFADPARAKTAYVIAHRAGTKDLADLRLRASDLAKRAGIKAPETLQDIADQIQLLLGVRDTLERFVPRVFDRSLDDLIVATGKRKDEHEMSGGDRRRLKQLAREYIRPGAHVADLHVAMKQIQAQREEWRPVAIAHTPPNAPTGIGDVQIQANAVISDLGELADSLEGTKIGRGLINMPLDELQDSLDRLTENPDALENLQQRSIIRQRLERLGLGALIRDFSTREIKADQVADELELAWWQSILELQLAGDGALLGADTKQIAELEQEFVSCDAAHVKMQSAVLEWALSQRWNSGIRDYPGEANDLKASLKEGSLTASDFASKVVELSRAVAPIWMVSPYTFPGEIPADVNFDTVIILDAAELALAEGVLPIAHSTQVIAFGDPALPGPSQFVVGPTIAPSQDAAGETAEAESHPATGIDTDNSRAADEQAVEPDKRSVFTALSSVLPRINLHTNYWVGGRTLVAVANSEFYQGSISALPSAVEFLNRKAVDVITIADGTGMPNPTTGLVEGVPGEVQKVVELVMGVAVWHPEDSLMVVTPSEITARMIRGAVRHEVAQKPHLQHFFRTDSAEPFVVLTTEQAATRTRDRAIFSVGYGRTPHGRVINHFGPITEPGGEQQVNVALTRARKQLAIVSCIRSKDLQVDRLDHGGKALAMALAGEFAVAGEKQSTDHQPLLDDLAVRLQKRGARVERRFGGVIPLAIADGDKVLALETDADFQGTSLRQAVRLRPQQLRALGWNFHRVYTFDLFVDPERVADEVMDVLHGKQHHKASARGNSERPERAKEDRDESWGDKPPLSRDEQIKGDKPPHWS